MTRHPPHTPNPRWIMARWVAMLILVTGFGALILIGPAYLLTGSVLWDRAWAILIILALSQFFQGLWLARTNPQLLRERMGIRLYDRGDQIVSAILVLCLLMWALLIPLDVFEWHLLPKLTDGWSLVLGSICLILGIVLNGWTLQHNHFGAAAVKLQHDRGQFVVDTGPYALVRHPMYSSFFLIFAGMAVLLQSTDMALLILPVALVGYGPRISHEEATLRKHLPGYEAYTRRVKWRVVPWVI